MSNLLILCAVTAYLIPFKSVTKKHLSGNKRGAAKISSFKSNGTRKDTQKNKVTVRLSEVKIWFHTNNTYSDLNNLQRNKLCE